jgi:hypothetical protein
MSGAHAHQIDYPFPLHFLFFLGLFYVFTCMWEFVFKGIALNSGRIVPDLICVVIIAVAYLTHQSTYYLEVAAFLIVLWFVVRSYAWRCIVFTRTNSLQPDQVITGAPS